MSEHKYTPVTDWVWERDTLFGKEDGYTVIICEADFPEENEQSDCHRGLIAAAPDMLVALKAVRDACIGFVPECAAQVDAAIAKAEGRA